MITTAIIAAVAENKIIGDKNTIPWNIRSELRHFRTTTLGKPVIMGRKTFEYLGKPLPDRSNIIVTRNKDFKAEGITIVHSIEEAIETGRKLAEKEEQDEVIIAGGGEIYNQAIDIADRIYLTRVHISPKGDVKFPNFNKQKWHEVKSEFHPAQGGETADYTIKIYDRIEH